MSRGFSVHFLRRLRNDINVWIFRHRFSFILLSRLRLSNWWNVTTCICLRSKSRNIFATVHNLYNFYWLESKILSSIKLLKVLYSLNHSSEGYSFLIKSSDFSKSNIKLGRICVFLSRIGHAYNSRYVMLDRKTLIFEIPPINTLVWRWKYPSLNKSVFNKSMKFCASVA